MPIQPVTVTRRTWRRKVMFAETAVGGEMGEMNCEMRMLSTMSETSSCTRDRAPTRLPATVWGRTRGVHGSEAVTC